jgi:hypothetical protein
MRPLARRLFIVSYKTYVLPTYFFDKSYISVFDSLHIFLFLKSSRFVRFVLTYNRFLGDPPFEGHNFGNKSLFIVIEEHRFVHL